MGVSAAQPISPELALVCPELRRYALTLLPALDPEALFEVRPRSTATGPTPPDRIRERPNLVLIEAERRSPLPVALAAYATEALFLGALRGAALTAVIAVVAFVLAH